MKRRIAVAWGFALLVGCATAKPMALSRETQLVDVSRESIVLMTIRLANKHKTGYQPSLRSVTVRSERPDGPSDAYKISDVLARDATESNQFEEAAVSVALPPGRYRIQSFAVGSDALFVHGWGLIPMNAAFEVKPGEIVYLGRAEATRRERKDDSEPRAGGVIPLIDQSVTGFSNGTFDVEIRDSFEDDLARLRKLYPALEKATVAKAVLPPWRRPTDEDTK